MLGNNVKDSIASGARYKIWGNSRRMCTSVRNRVSRSINVIGDEVWQSIRTSVWASVYRSIKETE